MVMYITPSLKYTGSRLRGKICIQKECFLVVIARFSNIAVYCFDAKRSVRFKFKLFRLCNRTSNLGPDK